jgi:hypothetical protein
MKAHLKQKVWPDPIIGYRRFVDGVCRAIFEDRTSQYICDERCPSPTATAVPPRLLTIGVGRVHAISCFSAIAEY